MLSNGQLEPQRHPQSTADQVMQRIMNPISRERRKDFQNLKKFDLMKQSSQSGVHLKHLKLK